MYPKTVFLLSKTSLHLCRKLFPIATISKGFCNGANPIAEKPKFPSETLSTSFGLKTLATSQLVSLMTFCSGHPRASNTCAHILPLQTAISCPPFILARRRLCRTCWDRSTPGHSRVRGTSRWAVQGPFGPQTRISLKWPSGKTSRDVFVSAAEQKRSPLEMRTEFKRKSLANDRLLYLSIKRDVAYFSLFCDSANYSLDFLTKRTSYP